jgi:hypothetical protein
MRLAGGLPRAQVGTGDTCRFNQGVLRIDPVAELGFERRLARRHGAFGLASLQSLIVLNGEDDRVNQTGLLHKHRLAFGLGADTAKTVFGFSSGDTHGDLLWMAILAIFQVVRTSR